MSNASEMMRVNWMCCCRSLSPFSTWNSTEMLLEICLCSIGPVVFLSAFYHPVNTKNFTTCLVCFGKVLNGNSEFFAPAIHYSSHSTRFALHSTRHLNELIDYTKMASNGVSLDLSHFVLNDAMGFEYSHACYCCEKLCDCKI